MQSIRGPILICGLTIALVLFSLFDAHGIFPSTFYELDQIELTNNYFNQFFSVFLLGLLLLCYIEKKENKTRSKPFPRSRKLFLLVFGRWVVDQL